MANGSGVLSDGVDMEGRDRSNVPSSPGIYFNYVPITNPVIPESIFNSTY